MSAARRPRPSRTAARRTPRAVAAAGLVVLLAGGLAACGGGDDEPDGPDGTAAGSPSASASAGTPSDGASSAATDPASVDPSQLYSPTSDDDLGPSQPTSGVPVPGDLVDPGSNAGLAVADLSQRTGVDAAAVAVVQVDEVQWKDGSIGCPDPDQPFYSQDPLKGERIILEADGKRYTYVQGNNADPFYCATPQRPEKVLSSSR